MSAGELLLDVLVELGAGIVLLALVSGTLFAWLLADVLRIEAGRADHQGMRSTNPNQYVKLNRCCGGYHDTRLPCPLMRAAAPAENDGPRGELAGGTAGAPLVCETHPTEPWTLRHQDECGPGMPAPC